MRVIWNGEDDIIKVVVLGESGVGKSSLALRFVSDEFQHYTDSTIGACYLSKSSEIETSQILPSRKVTLYQSGGAWRVRSWDFKFGTPIRIR
jgi:GTPase SAR1 family protein